MRVCLQEEDSRPSGLGTVGSFRADDIERRKWKGRRRMGIVGARYAAEKDKKEEPHRSQLCIRVGLRGGARINLHICVF
jgi:hypothetical protein